MEAKSYGIRMEARKFFSLKLSICMKVPYVYC